MTNEEQALRDMLEDARAELNMIREALGVPGETVYRVRVKGNAAGDLRFRVQLTCDQLKTPVIKEESTTFVKE